jgi:hypothetical protein
LGGTCSFRLLLFYCFA